MTDHQKALLKELHETLTKLLPPGGNGNVERAMEIVKALTAK